MHCIRRRIPFFGVALTSSHLEKLIAKLECEVFEAMQDPKDKLAQPGLIELLTREGTNDGEAPKQKSKREATKGGDQPPPSKKPKPAPKSTESSREDILARVAALTAAASAGEPADSQG